MMAWRSLSSCALAALALLTGASASADPLGIRVQIFPFTGEVRIQNRNDVALPMISYSITSASGALNGANGVWKSITDVYDENGNGFIAPTTLWQETSATANLLSEQSQTGFAGILPALRTVSLGTIWNPNLTPDPDLVVVINQSVTEQALVDIRRSIDGDYDDDRTVDADDYNLWALGYGSVAGPMFFYPSDGNIDGAVNAADYTVWRNNLGLDLTGAPGTGSGGIADALSVPEPATVFMAATAVAIAIARRGLRSAAATSIESL